MNELLQKEVVTIPLSMVFPSGRNGEMAFGDRLHSRQALKSITFQQVRLLRSAESHGLFRCPSRKSQQAAQTSSKKRREGEGIPSSD